MKIVYTVEKVLRDIASRSGKLQRVILTSHRLSADLLPVVEKSPDNKKYFIIKKFNFYRIDYNKNIYL